MSDTLRLEFLGGLQISKDGEPVTGFVSSKAVALLAYLAMNAGEHRRETLAGLFWGGSTEEDARASLRVVLSNLRQTVGRDCLVASRTTVAFDREVDYWLDVEEFEQNAGGSPSTIASLQRASTLYNGDLLQGITLSDAPAFDEWLTARREYLRQIAIAALDGLTDNASGASDHTSGIDYLTRLLELDPWREEAHRRLMTMLVHSGRRNAAIQQYERCRQLLAAELGVEPEPATTALYDSIRNDELQPERATDIPATPGHLDADHVFRPQAARPPTSFVGRETELGQIVERLNDPACRLLTLVGPGGIGKSRLALEASADRRIGFRDGVHVISLAPLGSPAYIVPTITAALDATLSESGDALSQLTQFLENKSLLLVLDNFEHLMDAVPLLNDIISAAPRVKLLVTSRERLALSGEWLITIGGLPTPDKSAGIAPEHSPSARLFIERARQASPDFAPSGDALSSLAHICRLLDGMPLGIELAAAWTRTHSCAEIAQRIEKNLDFLTVPMRDVPERHHSLRAVFMHSWELLDRRGQAVLQDLSVFRGGFDSDAARAVAGATEGDLADLIDKSLLSREPSGRYTLHEMVRQYASEQLDASPTATEVRRRHATHFGELLRGAEPALRRSEQQDTVRYLQADIDNIRVAWRWAVTNRDTAILDDALDGFQIFTDLTNRLHESRAILENGLAALDAGTPARPEDDLLRGRLLGWLSRHHMKHGNFHESDALIAQCRQLLDEHASAQQRVYALDTQAMIANARGRQREAQQLQQAALAAAEAIGDLIGMSLAFRGLGGIAFDSGDFRNARAWFHRCYQIREQLRDWDYVVGDLSRLGEIARLLGNYREARSHNEAALAIQRELGGRIREILPIRMRGRLALDEGRLEDAERDFLFASERARAAGMQRSMIECDLGLATVMLHRADSSDAGPIVEQCLAAARNAGFTNGVLTCLEVQAQLAARDGDWQCSEQLAAQLVADASATGHQFLAGRGETLQGRAAAKLGDVARAGQLLDAAYTRLGKTGARPALLDVVASAAELFAGTTAPAPDRAAELAAFVERHPATWFRTRERAAALVSDLSEQLPAPTIEAAHQRAAQQTLTNLALPWSGRLVSPN